MVLSLSGQYVLENIGIIRNGVVVYTQGAVELFLHQFTRMDWREL